MSKANMRYRTDYVTVKSVGNQIFIEAQSWGAKRWAVKKLKAEAEKLGIDLVKDKDKYLVSYNDISKVEKQLIPALIKNNV